MFRILRSNNPLGIGRAFRVARRKFSDKPPAGEASDAEKAAVVNKTMGSWMKKYGVIIVPGVIFAVVSVDMVSVLPHREWMEKVFPSYIALLREHYGFDDEDPAERQKMRSLNHYYKKPVKIQLKQNHNETVIEVPTGMTNLEDFLLHDDVTKTYFSTIQDIYCSDILSFVDDDGEEEESEFSRERYEQDPRDLKPEEYVRCDLITAGSPFVNSLWTSDVFTKRADISPYFLYYSQFENVCQQFNKGMRAYREYSSFLFTPAQATSSEVVRERKKKYNDLNLAREIALEKIKSLEHEIVLLNDEKRVGRRAIDVIDQDIQQRRNQINNLRRAYVNYFYFF